MHRNFFSFFFFWMEKHFWVEIYDQVLNTTNKWFFNNDSNHSIPVVKENKFKQNT